MVDPPTTRPPRSRREMPAKPALTREGIVAAALELLRAEPEQALTLRRIAAALDTGPASLFVYVRNTADLHAQMLEALLEQVVWAAPGAGTWDDQLVALLSDYTRLLYEYPGVARHTLFTRPHGPNYLTLLERMLALLQQGGVPGRDAAWAVDVLLQLTTANAAEQSAHRADPEAQRQAAALAVRLASADAGRYPHIARLEAELLSGPDRLAWKLRALIAGIVAVRRPVSPEPVQPESPARFEPPVPPTARKSRRIP